MSYCTEIDQEQRLASYQAIEDIYLEGVTDGADGHLPAMSEIVYLQGYCVGMEQGRKELKLKMQVSAKQVQSEMFAVEPKEYPLTCGQCQYLNDGICAIKATPRISANYACDRILVDSPF